MRRSEQRREAVFACYQCEVTGSDLQDVLGRAREGLGATAFTRDLAEGAARNASRFDSVIDAKAVGWSVERIAPLERCILRVAIHELTERPDVPAEVALDEAVEMAKRYCQVGAPAFVNGILGAVLRDLPAERLNPAEGESAAATGVDGPGGEGHGAG